MTTQKGSKSSSQKFHKGDVVLVANYYPWIWKGIVAHKIGCGESAEVVGSYTDQYPWGGEHGKHQYTLLFDKYGRVSWYDEDKLTLLKKAL